MPIMDAQSPRCWAGRLSGPSKRGSLLGRASVSLRDATGPQECRHPLDLGRGIPLGTQDGWTAPGINASRARG